MATLRTLIDGYHVDLEVWSENGEMHSQGTVSKRHFSGSIERMYQQGDLESSDGTLHSVPERTANHIYTWAVQHGY